jgi:hypothetical protein
MVSSIFFGNIYEEFTPLHLIMSSYFRKSLLRPKKRLIIFQKGLQTMERTRKDKIVSLLVMKKKKDPKMMLRSSIISSRNSMTMEMMSFLQNNFMTLLIPFKTFHFMNHFGMD